MTANAVNDLLVEPRINGVCGVTLRPLMSALPKPFRYTICLSFTMPIESPGIPVDSICYTDPNSKLLACL